MREEKSPLPGRQTDRRLGDRDALRGVETEFWKYHCCCCRRLFMNLICHGPQALHCWELCVDPRPETRHYQHSFKIWVVLPSTNLSHDHRIASNFSEGRMKVMKEFRNLDLLHRRNSIHLQNSRISQSQCSGNSAHLQGKELSYNMIAMFVTKQCV